MIDFIFLAVATATPLDSRISLPCDGIGVIEASLIDRPLPFNSLRQQDQIERVIRNAQGQRVRQMVPVTNVKPINGFVSCRFLYTAQIDLACYIGTTFARTDVENVAAALTATATGLRQCLTNTKLVQANEEPGSTAVVTFGAGASEPFWQVAMVPTQGDPDRVQPEILVLPSVDRANPKPTASQSQPMTTRARPKRR